MPLGRFPEGALYQFSECLNKRVLPLGLSITRFHIVGHEEKLAKFFCFLNLNWIRLICFLGFVNMVKATEFPFLFIGRMVFWDHIYHVLSQSDNRRRSSPPSKTDNRLLRFGCRSRRIVGIGRHTRISRRDMSDRCANRLKDKTYRIITRIDAHGRPLGYQILNEPLSVKLCHWGRDSGTPLTEVALYKYPIKILLCF